MDRLAVDIDRQVAEKWKRETKLPANHGGSDTFAKVEVAVRRAREDVEQSNDRDGVTREVRLKGGVLLRYWTSADGQRKTYDFEIDGSDAKGEAWIDIHRGRVNRGAAYFEEQGTFRRLAPEAADVVDYIGRSIHKKGKIPFSVHQRHRADPALLADGRFAAERRKFFEDLVRRLGPGNSRKVGWGGDSRPAWAEVRTFQELALMTTFFLRGLAHGAPYHDGPIDNDTRNIVLKDLVRVNAAGFVTHDGQPPSIESGLIERGPDKGKIHQTEQKSYLSGFLPQHHLAPFRAFMKRKRGVAFVQVYALPSKTILLNTFPRGQSYNVTRDRVARTEEELKTTEWRLYSNVPLVKGMQYDADVFEKFPKVMRVVERECVGVELAGHQYGGRPTMEAVMLEYLATPEARELTAPYRFAP